MRLHGIVHQLSMLVDTTHACAAPSAQVETIRANVIGCLTLADCCMQRDIHMLYYGTGCIFHYDDEHPIGGKGFEEEDKPNFTGSYYSHTKAIVENLLKARSLAVVWVVASRSGGCLRVIQLWLSRSGVGGREDRHG